eukprot:gene45189-56272_t
MTQPPPSLRSADLRGAVRLATDATAGLTGLVEAMHERIARLPGFAPTAQAGRTTGITGLVYKTVRGVTRVAGGSIDALLGLLGPVLGTGRDSPEREAVVAALNGVLGDYLVTTTNPLATPMSLRVAGPATGRVVVLAHGLCMNDLQWQRNGHDHGAMLARERGYTALYLHYNTGRHISENGDAFAHKLETLLAQWPVPVEELVIVGHSMGGLVARSACHDGARAGHRWLAQLSKLVFLGSPHHGAPLERGGNWVHLLTGLTPYTAPFTRLAKLRSAGITDLRHGSLLEGDWAGRDRFAHGNAPPAPVPLPSGVACYAVAATIGKDAGQL